MSAPETFATRFARTVDLFRDASAKEDQKQEFRALVGLLQDAAFTLKPEGDRIVVNGTMVEGAPVASLIQRLELHGVSELTIPQDPPPSHVFELIKALADQPGADDIPTRLRNSGAERISVAIAQLFPTTEPGPAAPAPPSAPAAGSQPVALGTEGILRGDPMTDIESPAVPVAGVPELTRTPPPPPPAMTPMAPASGSPEPPVAQDSPLGVLAPAAKPQSSGDTLQELERNPQAPGVPDLLAILGRQVETAVDAGRIEQALQVIAGIVRSEQLVPEGSLRRHYGIALKRMYTKTVLKGFAQLLSAPKHRTEAMLALRRSGEDGVEVLLDVLVTAPSMAERRGAFDALVQMTEGANQLVHMLGHPEWFVVRNVAELVGELGMEAAVPALAKQLGHEDQRVRKAVALALAKIGTRSAAEPLRRALRDKSPEVRMQAALGIGGRKSSPLAMPLVVALEEEKDHAVQREIILALGRIGSADAVQALVKFAQPSGRIFGRTPTALRVAAIEALRLAGTPAAVGTLEGLGRDSDKQVKAAAQTALADLKKK